MTVSTIYVKASYPLDKHSSCFVIVGPQCTVAQIIENALNQMYPSFHVNPSRYGLLVQPQNQWMLPKCFLSDYIDYLSPTKIEDFYIQHRNLISITVICLHFKSVVSCDPNQPAKMLIEQVISNLSKQEDHQNFFDWKNWSLWEGDKRINLDMPCEPLSNHIIQMRRESSFHDADKEVFNTAVFKKSLDSSIDVEDEEDIHAIPEILEYLFQKVEANPKIEGIFRKSGGQANIDAVIAQVDAGSEINIKELIDSQQPHDVTGILKSYFRMLPEPLFPPIFYDKFVDASSISTLETRLPFYHRILDTMPAINYAVLKRLSQCLKIITDHSEENKMNMYNIVICLMPALVRSKSEGDQAAMLMKSKVQATIGCDLFDYPEYMFETKTITIPSKTVKCIKQNELLKEGEKYQILDEKVDKITVQVNERQVEVPTDCLERDPDITIEPFKNWAFNDSQCICNLQYLPINRPKTAKGVNESIEKQIEHIEQANKALKKKYKKLNSLLTTIEKNNDEQIDKDKIKRLIEEISHVSSDLF
ncbi:hypothetical protein TRFO_13584 [Tritrichomonas foetus]|uniref:Rho-GAP domain-containing protein n=1 Tax=Tritrichomonas foetus TaxID=1144522 RepID=A0A1J4KYH2_9EUKA|nr:hypothetical protein TRFO_13584 [Tritrichomonas foetus]|eukprot:OHT15928.1 hypothetical protein TRFO_13584 [Tritrichomonas foetus]